jgi:hypothetical protein
VFVQDVRWKKVRTAETEDFIFYGKGNFIFLWKRKFYFFMEKEIKIINWEQVFCTPQKSNQQMGD